MKKQFLNQYLNDIEKNISSTGFDSENIMKVFNKNKSNNKNDEIILVDTTEIAKILSFSIKFIERQRENIIGAQKIGRVWRFNKKLIIDLLNKGEDILINQDDWNSKSKKGGQKMLMAKRKMNNKKNAK